MKTKNKILQLLEENKGKVLSGEEIASLMNMSRAGVWKAINALKKEGYEITASQNKGYCLNAKSNILSAEGIKAKLNNKEIEVLYKEQTTSTNDDLLTLAQTKKNGIAIEVTSSQSAGRGRLGRTFLSPKGGIYFSILLLDIKQDIKNVTIITPMAAVAVARAIKKVTGKDLYIKWVNDLFYKDKKVCGILTQANFDIETNTLSNIVVGIGLDYQIDLTKIDPALKNIVGTLYEKKEEVAYKNEIVAQIINEFLDLCSDFNSREFVKEYKERSCVLGKEVTFLYNREEYEGIAVDIDENCSLIVQFKNGNRLSLNSGEISITRKT